MIWAYFILAVLAVIWVVMGFYFFGPHISYLWQRRNRR